MKEYAVRHITHTDLDGVACSVLSHYMYDNNPNIDFTVTYCDYDNVNEEVLRQLKEIEEIGPAQMTLLLITDISVTEETARKIDELQQSLFSIFICRLIDHHQLSQEMHDYRWTTINSGGNECGTSLLFKDTEFFSDTFKNKGMADFVEAVRLYDLWKFDKENRNKSVDLNHLRYILGIEPFIELITAILRREDDNIVRTDIEGSLINTILVAKYGDEADYITKKLKLAKDVEYKGHKGKYVFAEQYISQLGNNMLKCFPDAEFAAIVDPNGKVSLRSREGGLNVGLDVAYHFGGGGHPQAAGYTMKPMVFTMEENGNA